MPAESSIDETEAERRLRAAVAAMDTVHPMVASSVVIVTGLDEDGARTSHASVQVPDNGSNFDVLTRRYEALADAVAALQDQMRETFAEVADLASIAAEALESEPPTVAQTGEGPPN